MSGVNEVFEKRQSVLSTALSLKKYYSAALLILHLNMDSFQRGQNNGFLPVELHTVL